MRICGKDNPIGFKLDLHVVRPGMVLANFPCSRVFQSYPETLHGGVISALLDATMTNCLSSLGEVAVTAELVVHYLRPTRVDQQRRTAMLRRPELPLLRGTPSLGVREFCSGEGEQSMGT